MGKPIFEPEKIPVKWELLNCAFGGKMIDNNAYKCLPANSVIDAPCVVDGREYRFNAVSMGNPHNVIFLEEDADSLDLTRLGPIFENLPAFPERVNTEFVNAPGGNRLKVRVWERGSGETYACGTGACAAAAAAVLTGRCSEKDTVTVDLKGGRLSVNIGQTGEIMLTGNATTAFMGEIDI
jgi:diaminopimelate epimerase